MQDRRRRLNLAIPGGQASGFTGSVKPLGSSANTGGLRSLLVKNAAQDDCSYPTNVPSTAHSKRYDRHGTEGREGLHVFSQDIHFQQHNKLIYLRQLYIDDKRIVNVLVQRNLTIKEIVGTWRAL